MPDDPETGILQSAEIELRNLDGIDYIPPTYPRYVPPEEVKGEYNSGILEIDKKLYQLPCPRSEFTDDGWEISVGVTGNTSHIVLEAFGGVSSWNLKKNGKNMVVRLCNHTFKTVCFGSKC